MANVKFTNTPSGEWADFTSPTSTWVWDTTGVEPDELDIVLEYVSLDATVFSGKTGNHFEIDLEFAELEGFSGGLLGLNLELVELTGVVELVPNAVVFQLELVDLVITGISGLINSDIDISLEHVELNLFPGASLDLELEPVIFTGTISMGMNLVLEYAELEMYSAFGASIDLSTKEVVIQMVGTASYNTLDLSTQRILLEAHRGGQVNLDLLKVQLASGIGNSIRASLDIKVQFPVVSGSSGAQVSLGLQSLQMSLQGSNETVAHLDLTLGKVGLILQGGSEISGSLDLSLRKASLEVLGGSRGPEEQGLILLLEEALLESTGSAWINSGLEFSLRPLEVYIEGYLVPKGDLQFDTRYIFLEGRLLNSVDGSGECSYEDLEFER